MSKPSDRFSPPEKLILRSFQRGDIVMLTAAVRDLLLAHPERFQVDVRTSQPALWENNPYLTPLDESAHDVRTIDMHYPLVQQCNERPYHFLHGFPQFLEEQLDVRIPLTRFHGDVHLSDQERTWPPIGDSQELPERYWLLMAGGKYDFTTKWWNPAYYQAVVDYFRGRIAFVQCGAAGDWHPALRGTVNLVGRTSVREFMRLMYWADGVICPLTFAMHLAAAVESPPNRSRLRPCVVIAGGREPAHWTAYPHHQFLSQVGQLPCCLHGGCWRSRCQLVGDGDGKDFDNLCESPVAVTDQLRLAECMVQITPEDVIERVTIYAPAAAAKENGRTRSSPRPAHELIQLPSLRRQRLRIDFPHGEIPAVMFTAVARALKSKYAGWDVEVHASAAAAPILDAQFSTTAADFQRPRPGNWDRILPIAWEPNASVYADLPSTAAAKCLLEELGIRPQLLDLKYQVIPAASALLAVDDLLDAAGVPRGTDAGRRRLLLFDAELAARRPLSQFLNGVSSSSDLHGALHACQRITVDLRIRLNGRVSIVDLALLIALTSRAAGLVSTPNLAVYLAAAVRTPAFALWTESHPIYEFDANDYVTHCLSKSLTRQLTHPPAASLFRRQYRHREYRRLADLADPLEQWLRSLQP